MHNAIFDSCYIFRNQHYIFIAGYSLLRTGKKYSVQTERATDNANMVCTVHTAQVCAVYERIEVTSPQAHSRMDTGCDEYDLASSVRCVAFKWRTMCTFGIGIALDIISL